MDDQDSSESRSLHQLFNYQFEGVQTLDLSKSLIYKSYHIPNILGGGKKFDMRFPDFGFDS